MKRPSTKYGSNYLAGCGEVTAGTSFSFRFKRARDIDRSDKQLTMLREGLERARSSILYGLTSGPTLADMKPFHGTASRFLEEVRVSGAPSLGQKAYTQTTNAPYTY